MNAILASLERNRESLRLEQYGVSPRSRYVLRTPRFRASRHVVLLHVPERSHDASLVVKVPRLSEDRDGIEREARALSAVQTRAERMAATIPRLIGVVDCCGHPALVQTALTGRPLDPATIRRDREKSCFDVTSWLIGFHRATSIPVDNRETWYDEQVQSPLKILEAALWDQIEDVQRIERARGILEPLRNAALPAVIEHGDLGHPNLFRLRSGGIGVIDWELAELHGAPLLDLWFFLSYAAGAQARSSSVDDQLAAFCSAFEGHTTWTEPYIERYVRELDIPLQTVAPLFVLTWTRYLSALARRLMTDKSDRMQLANWIRNNRYYAFWRHALLPASGVQGSLFARTQP